jgi:hypothetical protein
VNTRSRRSYLHSTVTDFASGVDRYRPDGGPDSYVPAGAGCAAYPGLNVVAGGDPTRSYIRTRPIPASTRRSSTGCWGRGASQARRERGRARYRRSSEKPEPSRWIAVRQRGPPNEPDPRGQEGQALPLLRLRPADRRSACGCRRAMSRKRGSSGWPGRVGFQHGSALLSPTSLPAADHPARDLALSPVHIELPG